MAESRRNGRRKELSARDAIASVRRELPQLLGKPIESVLGVERDEDSAWRVTVQVVELSRIPNTTDVLGAYAVTLDRDGDLTGYSRKRRYYRNQTDEE
jgi:hypothetical protein